jgi:hypothetical protein
MPNPRDLLDTRAAATYTALTALASVASASQLSEAIAIIEQFGGGLDSDRGAIADLQHLLDLYHNRQP